MRSDVGDLFTIVVVLLKPPTCVNVIDSVGSSVGECLIGRLLLSLSVKPLEAKTIVELSIFLVIGSYNRRAWLKCGWLHLDILKLDCWPKIDQAAIVVADLSEEVLRDWMRFVISMVTGS